MKPSNRTTTTARIDGDATLNEIVAQHPGTHPVLLEFGLDTCCGGNTALHKACAAHGLDFAHVLDKLTEVAR